ncbi:MAG: YitT family protein [Clostridia bacterium]|jgi:uncharacterized membrane-anchored protein YitT (DUF2179 family)|nr:YitT family protein [Clostridia bacterium]
MLENLKKYLMIFTGIFFLTLAINNVFIPFKILSGGITGFTLFVHLLTGAEKGMTFFLMNIPLVIIGFIFVNRKFMIETFITMFTLSLALKYGSSVDLNIQSSLNAMFFGGVTYGLGLGIIFKTGASTGGIDILAKIAKKYFNYSMGTFLITFNLIIVALSAYFFNIDSALNTMIVILIYGQVSNLVVRGFNRECNVFIISEKEKEIVMMIESIFGNEPVEIFEKYAEDEDTNKKMIFYTVRYSKVPMLEENIKAIDPEAYVTITETLEVVGKQRLI